MLKAILNFFKQFFCFHKHAHNDDYYIVCSDCNEILDYDNGYDDDYEED